jgi:hypothetical protein
VVVCVSVAHTIVDEHIVCTVHDEPTV